MKFYPMTEAGERERAADEDEETTVMHHIRLRPCCTRPMTRSLSDLPNQDGYKFFGIDENGNRRRCIVKKGDDEIHRVFSQAQFSQKLIGWQPYL